MIYKPEDLNLVQIEEVKDGESCTTIIAIQFKDGTQKIFEIDEYK
jgi:hypothetical protein